jgi:6-phosphogluconolactonase (cycloisomerase 2 family)
MTHHEQSAAPAVTRRAAMLGAVGAVAGPAGPALAQARPRRRVIAYVGAYTDRGKGIHIFGVNTENGRLTPIKEVTGVLSPSALAFDPQRRFLYAANEVQSFEGQPTGGVTAFGIDRANGDLRRLNAVSSGGPGPAHLSVEPGGKFVLVANYAAVPPTQLPGASVAVIPIQQDGSLGAASDVVALPREPLGPRRATGAPPGSFADSGHDAPHAHQAITDPAGRFVLVTDLGTDRIYVYRFDKTAGKLTPNNPAFFQAAPGVGPRHIAFHPGGRFCYSLNEEASTLDFLTWDPERGAFERRQTLSTLPRGYEGTNYPSEVEVSDDGRFVHAANRLHDSIAAFALARNGSMTYAGEAWTRGSYPRHFATEPTKRFTYVLHTRSDNITIFRANRANGTLAFTDQYVGVGNPSQIVFLTL